MEEIGKKKKKITRSLLIIISNYRNQKTESILIYSFILLNIKH